MQNPHYNEQYDDVVTLSFKHFDYRAYVTDEKQMGLGYTITSDEAPLQHGISFGMSKQKIIELFGKPGRGTDDYIVYETSTEYPPAIKFILKDNKLQSISVNYYFD